MASRIGVAPADRGLVFDELHQGRIGSAALNRNLDVRLPATELRGQAGHEGLHGIGPRDDDRPSNPGAGGIGRDIGFHDRTNGPVQWLRLGYRRKPQRPREHADTKA